MQSEVKNIVFKLKEYFSQLYGENFLQLILFGSQARGDAASFSDIDIMIVLKGQVNPIQEIKRTNPFIAQLSLEYDKDITCLFMPEDRFKNEDMPLLRNVRKEGISWEDCVHDQQR
jgi:predicted nucleotidyltransferase